MAFLIPQVVIRPRVYISGKFSEDAADALWAPPCQRIGLPPLSFLLLLSSHTLLSFSTSFSSKSIFFDSFALSPFFLFSFPLSLPRWYLRHLARTCLQGFVSSIYPHNNIYWAGTKIPSCLPSFPHSSIRSTNICWTLLCQALSKKSKIALREFSVCLGKAGSHKHISHYIITRCH